VTTSYSYNRRNRLTGIQHTLGATVLLGLAYTLDASGLRTGIAETGTTNRTVTYAYDGIKRLTSESVVQLGNDRRTSWTYDKTGNRLTQTKSLGPSGSPTGTATTTYVYDANDRLDTETLNLSGTVPGATAGTTTYTFDAAGNTTKKVSPSETIDYVYDDANRLAELQTLAGDVTRYTYAHDGTRLSRTTDATGANPVTTHYLVDPNHAYAQVIEEAEQQGSGAPTLKALYAVGDDRIRRYTPAVAGSGGGPSIPAGLRYYHADGLGSTRLLTDDTAAITDQLTYEAFGELDAAASVQTSDNAFMYTGEQFDPNAGFYYLRARYMSPHAGRFMQMDSFSGYFTAPVSLHKYAYAEADPARNTDPSGMVTLGEVGATLKNIAILSMRVATSTYNIYTKIDDALTWMQVFKGVTAAIQNFPSPSSVGQDAGFVKALRNTDEALIDVAKNIPRIISGIKRYKGEKLRGFMNDPTSKLVIFGPTPELPIPFNMPETKIFSIKLTKKAVRDVVLSFDTPTETGGRFLGMGHKNSAGGTSQWWRMDWHPIGPPTKHPIPTPQQEITNEYWTSGSFHHHTRK
jgi:RHS repeat-associated protein